MYDWRKMTAQERRESLALRCSRKLPWHSPPHFDFEGTHYYLVTAACYEHRHFIGRNPERMTECAREFLEAFRKFCFSLYAWCILPNHYHALARTDRIKGLRHALGQFHGRSAFRWMPKTMLGAVKSGITASSDESSRSAISGPP